MHIAITQTAVVIAVLGPAPATRSAYFDRNGYFVVVQQQRWPPSSSTARNVEHELLACADESRHHLRAQSHRPPPVPLTLATVPRAARSWRSVRVVRRRASWTRALGAVRERRSTRRPLRTWERASASSTVAT
jgi:hypothetical protein